MIKSKHNGGKIGAIFGFIAVWCAEHHLRKTMCWGLQKCDKGFFLDTNENKLFFAFWFPLMRESLKCNLKCISHLFLPRRHDKIKIALVKDVEQINAYNINIYVLVSVHVYVYTLSYISVTSINLAKRRKVISWGNK